ncbi:MAG: C_GCAxxG_C_C family protein [Ruminococcaceae bacterium]|nr:C_GCAxxG_C_C family protein [Oscillospiraceae bacterium]
MILASETYSDRAERLFLSGYNCAQALYGAFAPAVGVEEKEALRLASPFGGGFGRMRQVCGAFSGMTLVVGHLFGYEDLSSPEKDALYPRVQELGKRFEARCNSLICKEILKNKVQVGGTASPRTEEYYKSRPCARVVRAAAEILEQYLKEEGAL